MGSWAPREGLFGVSTHHRIAEATTSTVLHRCVHHLGPSTYGLRDVTAQSSLRDTKMVKIVPPEPSSSAIDPMVLGAAVVVLAILAILVKLFSGPSKAKFLNKQRQQLTLGERVNLSHDTVRFRFVLPKATPVLGLPVGQHIKVYAPTPKGKKAGEWNGKEDDEGEDGEIERKYTPTTSDDDTGYVDLVLKVYKGGVIDRFPDGGKMSQYFDTLKVSRKPKAGSASLKCWQCVHTLKERRWCILR